MISFWCEVVILLTILVDFGLDFFPGVGWSGALWCCCCSSWMTTVSLTPEQVITGMASILTDDLLRSGLWTWWPLWLRPYQDLNLSLDKAPISNQWAVNHGTKMVDTKATQTMMMYVMSKSSSFSYVSVTTCLTILQKEHCIALWSLEANSRIILTWAHWEAKDWGSRRPRWGQGTFAIFSPYWCRYWLQWRSRPGSKCRMSLESWKGMHFWLTRPC